MYALAAMGFTLLWQTSSTINFAQGEFVMLPAFVVLVAATRLGLPMTAAFLLTVALSAVVLGVLFKRLLVDRLIGHGVLPLVIATIALGIALRQAVKLAYGAEAYPFPDVLPAGRLVLGGAVVATRDLAVLGVVAGLVLGLELFLSRTLLGRSMQAVAQSPETARILGIDVERMVLLTFVINAVLAATAALLVAPVYLAKFDLGESLGLKAFYAAIIGGFNRMRGALVGGLAIGMVENLAAAYVSDRYRDAVPLLLFVAVVLLRPEGLLGRVEQRRL